MQNKTNIVYFYVNKYVHVNNYLIVWKDMYTDIRLFSRTPVQRKRSSS